MFPIFFLSPVVTTWYVCSCCSPLACSSLMCSLLCLSAVLSRFTAARRLLTSSVRSSFLRWSTACLFGLVSFCPRACVRACVCAIG